VSGSDFSPKSLYNTILAKSPFELVVSQKFRQPFWAVGKNNGRGKKYWTVEKLKKNQQTADYRWNTGGTCNCRMYGCTLYAFKGGVYFFMQIL